MELGQALAHRTRAARTGRQALGASTAALALVALGCGSDQTGPQPPPPDAVGTIRTVAGVPGTAGFNGDGIAMSFAQLNAPQAVGIGPTGLLCIADVENQRVRGGDLTSGLITTLVGTGASGAPAPGPALECPLDDPGGMAWDALGRMAFPVVHSNVVLQLLGGSVDIIAGDGTGGFGGDGGPATEAQLDHPTCVAYDPDGNLYILDQQNGRIRHVDGGGSISTYAGIGGQGYAGDGGAIATAQFNFPHGQSPRMTLAPPEVEPAAERASKHSYSRLYITDTGNHRVRMINMTAETVALVAGSGTAGYSGDGGSPLASQLNLPTGVALGPDESLYIADTGNNVVRRIDPLGVIGTIAGSGTAGYGGDGGPATAARLNAPAGLFVDAAGTYLYIADAGNHAVRRVLLR